MFKTEAESEFGGTPSYLSVGSMQKPVRSFIQLCDFVHMLQANHVTTPSIRVLTSTQSHLSNPRPHFQGPNHTTNLKQAYAIRLAKEKQYNTTTNFNFLATFSKTKFWLAFICKKKEPNELPIEQQHRHHVSKLHGLPSVNSGQTEHGSGVNQGTSMPHTTSANLPTSSSTSQLDPSVSLSSQVPASTSGMVSKTPLKRPLDRGNHYLEEQSFSAVYLELWKFFSNMKGKSKSFGKAILEAVGLQLRFVSSTLVADVLCWFSELCSWPFSFTSAIGNDNLKGYNAKNAITIFLYILEAITIEHGSCSS